MNNKYAVATGILFSLALPVSVSVLQIGTHTLWGISSILTTKIEWANGWCLLKASHIYCRLCMCCKCYSDGASARHHYLRSLNASLMLLNSNFTIAKTILHTKLFICLSLFACCTFHKRLFSNKTWVVTKSASIHRIFLQTSRELCFCLTQILLNIQSDFNSCVPPNTFFFL